MRAESLVAPACSPNRQGHGHFGHRLPASVLALFCQRAPFCPPHPLHALVPSLPFPLPPFPCPEPRCPPRLTATLRLRLLCWGSRPGRQLSPVYPQSRNAGASPSALFLNVEVFALSGKQPAQGRTQGGSAAKGGGPASGGLLATHTGISGLWAGKRTRCRTPRDVTPSSSASTGNNR